MLFAVQIMAKSLEERLLDAEKHWKDDPVAFKMLLKEYVQDFGEGKQIAKDCMLTHSKSTDPMVRFMKERQLSCEFEETQGTCRISSLQPDPEHLALVEIKFAFRPDGAREYGKEEYAMTHVYRNPFRAWSEDNGIEAGQESPCAKLEKKSGPCDELEWRFDRYD